MQPAKFKLIHGVQKRLNVKGFYKLQFLESRDFPISSKLCTLCFLQVVTDALSGPQVLERVGGTVDFAGNVFRTGVCHLFCPLQTNGTNCRQEHCGPRNETERDPDYVYYDNYVDFEPSLLEEAAESEDNEVSEDV